MLKIAITGHRPNKLWGYNLNADKYKILSNKILEIFNDNEGSYAISGMALGVDTLYAQTILDLKLLRPEVKLECAIPCRNHSSKWFKESVTVYNDILSKADKVTLVSDCEYNPSVMQRRNEYMVDQCDLLIAVWDGSSGGTGNCVKYAERIGKSVIRITPSLI